MSGLYLYQVVCLYVTVYVFNKELPVQEQLQYKSQSWKHKAKTCSYIILGMISKFLKK